MFIIWFDLASFSVVNDGEECEDCGSSARAIQTDETVTKFRKSSFIWNCLTFKQVDTIDVFYSSHVVDSLWNEPEKTVNMARLNVK